MSALLIWGFENRIFIADADTKKTRELGISRDGRLIYYTLYTSESDIWLLDHSDNEQR